MTQIFYCWSTPKLTEVIIMHTHMNRPTGRTGRSACPFLSRYRRKYRRHEIYLRGRTPLLFFVASRTIVLSNSPELLEADLAQVPMFKSRFGGYLMKTTLGDVETFVLACGANPESPDKTRRSRQFGNLSLDERPCAGKRLLATGSSPLTFLPDHIISTAHSLATKSLSTRTLPQHPYPCDLISLAYDTMAKGKGGDKDSFSEGMFSFPDPHHRPGLHFSGA